MSYQSTQKLWFFVVLAGAGFLFTITSPNFPYYSYAIIDDRSEKMDQILSNSSRELLSLKRSSDNLEHVEQCLKEHWEPDKMTHPQAPIRFLPSYDRILINPIKHFSFCKPEIKNLRLVFVLSRCNSSDLRTMARKTYANFGNYKPGSLTGNWSLFFIVGNPTTTEQLSLVDKESRSHGDVVVANVSEQYDKLTLKTLVAIKIAYCYCPQAEYLIKTDDDIYLLPFKIDSAISEVQKRANFLGKLAQVNSTQRRDNGPNVPIFSGARCDTGAFIQRKGPQGVSEEIYPLKTVPFYCWGALYLFSMSVVRNLTRECPRHCTGQFKMSNYTAKSVQFCHTKTEDVFMGSCVTMTQHNYVTGLGFDPNLFRYVHRLDQLETDNASKHIAVHSLKHTRDWEKTHEYYVAKKIIY